MRTITRPSSTCCQAPQALGLRGRGRKEGAPPSAPSHVQVSSPGDVGPWSSGKGVGRGARFRVGRGQNTHRRSTDNSGDKPESWTFGKLGPTPNRDTLPEASSDPCMAVSQRLPQREHPKDPIKNPRAPPSFLVSGSSVFWSRLSSSPYRRTPSLGQGQRREGECETGQ